MKQDTLRQAFAQFATGVTLITTREVGKVPNKVYAMTVNSFTSVSLDPPLLLWCLGRSEGAQDSYNLFKDSDSFSVSVLSAAQENLSRLGAQHQNHEIAEDLLGDNLFVKGALAGFACVVEDKIPAGDHLIMIGRIERCEVFSRDLPLVFHQKKYLTL